MKTALTSFFIICTSTLVFAQQYVIQGNISGFKNGTKFYLKDIETEALVDSAYISNNRFTMKGKLPETPQILWVYTIVEQTFYYTTLLIGNEKVGISRGYKKLSF